jgi:hypothetical protein
MNSNLAAGRDLNSGQIFPRILPMRVLGTTCVVCFIILVVVKFDDIFLDDELKQSREHISTKVTSESLHDPEELG